MHSLRAVSPDQQLRNIETLRQNPPSSKIIRHDFNPECVLTLPTSFGRLEVAKSIAPEHGKAWVDGLDHLPHDHRYYEITQRTLNGQFRHYYLFLRDHERRVRVIQPFLIVDQDLMGGLPKFLRKLISNILTRTSPKSKMRMLMVGCSAGEGHLARDAHAIESNWTTEALAVSLRAVGKAMGASLVVFKDFPKAYRDQLIGLKRHGFTRVPSMPGSKLELNFTSFDGYLQNRLSHKTRKNLRAKFRKSAETFPLEMEVRTEIAAQVDELFPLYQQVLRKSQFKFEELTRDYFIDLGRRMGDRSLFFIWRHQGKAVAFCSCVGHKGVLRDNYIGLDYGVAFKGHLYFVTMRDMLNWALANGYHTYYSAPLNYEPKYHLRHDLVPLDLYVQATAGWLNPMLRLVLPFLEPTRYDPFIRKFANAPDLL